MKALSHFYEDLGDKIWTEYGFVDAFNETENWFANSHLAIDQGPIIVMIENYRTGLLWKLFMGNSEIQNGLRILGFDSPYLKCKQLFMRLRKIYCSACYCRNNGSYVMLLRKKKTLFIKRYKRSKLR